MVIYINATQLLLALAIYSFLLSLDALWQS